MVIDCSYLAWKMFIKSRQNMYEWKWKWKTTETDGLTLQCDENVTKKFLFFFFCDWGTEVIYDYAYGWV